MPNSSQYSLNYKVTPAIPREAQEIATVHVNAWRDTYRGIVPEEHLENLDYKSRAEMWQNILSRSPVSKEHTLVTKDPQGVVVGFVSGGKLRKEKAKIHEGEIYAIYLEKSHQKKGLGQKLLLESLEALYREGFTQAMAWVLKDNPAAQFYEAMGAKMVSEKWDEIGGKKLLEYGYLWENIWGTLKRAVPELRHPCIKHYLELQGPDTDHYPGSSELLSQGAPFAKYFGFERLGIHHELLKPGRRTSWPHAESTEDEFAYVLEGAVDVWIDGHLYPLKVGDSVGFKAGSGISHTFINNSRENAALLVVGDKSRDDDKCFYPLHPKRNEEIKSMFWEGHPVRELGPHNGESLLTDAD